MVDRACVKYGIISYQMMTIHPCIARSRELPTIRRIIMRLFIIDMIRAAGLDAQSRDEIDQIMVDGADAFAGQRACRTSGLDVEDLSQVGCGALVVVVVVVVVAVGEFTRLVEEEDGILLRLRHAWRVGRGGDDAREEVEGGMGAISDRLVVRSSRCAWMGDGCHCECIRSPGHGHGQQEAELHCGWLLHL